MKGFILKIHPEGNLRIGLMLLAGLLLMAEAGLAADKLRFGIQVRTNPRYLLPILASQEKGFFKEQGVELEYFPFTSGPTAHRAMAASLLDIALNSLLSMTQAVARGSPERAVADIDLVEDWFMWVLPDSRMKALQDLKGTKISVTTLGSLTHALARAISKSAGVEKEMRIVAAGGTPARIAALKSGATQVTVAPYLTMAPLKVKGEVREFLNVGDYAPRPVLSQILTSHEGVVRSKPDVIRRGIRAFVRGARFTMENKPWALEKMMTHSDLNYAKEVAEVVYPKLTYASTEKKISRADLRTIVAWLVDTGLLRPAEAPPLDKLSPAEFSE